jgi:glutamyl-tRNA synthetase
MTEIIELFTLEAVHKAPAFFDMKKLDHINATYIRALPVDDFIERCEPWLTNDAPWPAGSYAPEIFAALAPVIQDKAHTLAAVPALVDWLFLADPPTDADSWRKAMVEGRAAPELIDGVSARLDDVEWTADAMYALVSEVGEANGLKLGQAQAPIRVAVSGHTVGLPLFESIVLLPREEVRRRLVAARARLD